jgi:EAL domain-containing protein (putative c-di-GMP-specific phosphodiesterase class I)
MPNAVYDPDRCLRATLLAADRCGFPTERIIFEFTETESVRDAAHLARIVARYRARGFRTAIDDFGRAIRG